MLEVIISSLIGLAMLYGAFTILLNNQSSARLSGSLSIIDEKGQLALDILADDIRRAGYNGCVSSQPNVLKGVNITESWMKPLAGIRGWDSAGTDYPQSASDALGLYVLTQSSFSSSTWEPHTASEKGTTISIPRGSDVIELWMAEPHVMRIVGAGETNFVTLNDTDPTLRVNNDSLEDFPSGVSYNLLLVSDCIRNVLVKTDNFDQNASPEALVSLHAGSTTGTALENARLLNSMRQPQGMLLEGVMYYLDIPAGASVPGLYRKKIAVDEGDTNKGFELKNGEELVPGILNLQFLYGVAGANSLSAQKYVSADQVNNWNDVVSVRIHLLVESDDANAAPVSSSFYYFGLTYQPENASDKKIRKEFTKTVTLRNRALGFIGL